MVAEIDRIAQPRVHRRQPPRSAVRRRAAGFARRHWDPVFAALCRPRHRHVPPHRRFVRAAQRPRDATIDHLIVLAPQLSAVIATDLMLGGVFRRFPELKVALSEGGIGWIPFFLDRMDRHVWNHRWTGLKITERRQDTDRAVPQQLPRLLHHRPLRAHLRDRIGIDSVAWECDYPHSDSTWPTSPEILRNELEGAPSLSRRRRPPHHLGERVPVLPVRSVRAHLTRGGDRRRAAIRAHDVDTSTTSRAEYKHRYQEAGAR